MHCDDTASSTICANCDGVMMDLPYHQAYIRSKDKKHCQRKKVKKFTNSFQSDNLISL